MRVYDCLARDKDWVFVQTCGGAFWYQCTSVRAAKDLYDSFCGLDAPVVYLPK